MTLEFGGLSLLTLLHLSIALPLCGHILLTKESVPTAVGWIALVLLSPLVGSGLYWVFGINRIYRKARKLRGDRHRDMPRLESSTSQITGEATQHERELELLKFARAVHDTPYTRQNSVSPLINGDAAYPAMLKAINDSSDMVALSVFIFDDDQAGLMFVDALVAAFKRGVSVKVLVDDMGMNYSSRPTDEILLKSGVSAARFIPRKLKHIPLINLRNHRKLLIVDGKVGFIGGMNISHGNLLESKPKKPIQDIHFRVTGPVLNQMNTLFEEDWHFATGEEIKLPYWQGNSTPEGNVTARLIPDGPDDHFEKLQWVILGALAFAKERVRIVTPYFLPNDIISSALMTTALRGVSVEVIIPQTLDIPFLDWAMTAKFKQLIEHGVRIYRSPPPFDHSKVFVVDGIWTLIGSTNWDQRSLRLNFEANLECLDPDFGAELDAFCSGRLAAAAPVQLDYLKNMPLASRLRNAFVHLFSPYL